MNGRIAIRGKNGRFSFLVRKKAVSVFMMLTVLLLVFCMLAICLGSRPLSPAELWSTALGQGTAESLLIVVTLRLPRLLVAVLVGAALGVSGAILQGIIRNPLASPDIIGISGGAAFAAVAFIAYFSGAVSIGWLPLAAFLGAALVSIVIYGLAWNRGVTPTRLVLVGIGISAITGSLTMLMITLSPIKAAGQAYIWLTGSIYGASWDSVYSLLPWVIVFIPFARAYARNVDVQQLGDDVANGLGAPVQRHRCALLLIAVALAGSAVAVAGAIGFVGLIAPHIARKLVGPTFGSLIPAAAMIGSLLVVSADTVARTAFLPLDVPAGVFTAAVGAPFFIYLLYRNRNT
ncbi:MAG: iron transporter permease [Paenibacillus sp.]|jgi:iron complex transport system permease protein|nr:iron transporter permease [Paenibacillus sp.]